MAIELRGFVEIPSFVSNVKDQVSAIGELSNFSRTFSRDQQQFSDPAKDVSELVVFGNKDTGTDVPVDPTVTARILDIFEASFADYVAGTPYTVQVETSFPDLTNIESGAQVTHLGKFLVEWLSFDMVVGADTVNVKVWLSDLNFRAEYTDYEIVVLPPAASVSDFYSDYNTAVNAKDTYGLQDRFTAIGAAQDGAIATEHKLLSLKWIDPLDPTKTFNTEWTIVGYGANAFAYENMLEAIRLYLTANSVYTVTQWVEFFPELINVDIFYVFPQWDRTALPSSPSSDALYSTGYMYDVGMDNLRKILTVPTLNTLKPVTDIISTSYKSLCVALVGKETNSIEKQRFLKYYYDYTVLPINDININRLRAITQSVMTKLETLYIQAEADTGSNTLPSNMVRSTYGTGTFIELTENNIIFRVCTKLSYLETI